MKKHLPLILALVAVVALLGVMQFLKEAPAPAAPEPTAAPATQPPLRVLIDQEKEPAVEVTLRYDSQETTYVLDSASGVYKAKDYSDLLSFDQTALRNLFGACNRLVSRKVIDAQPEDLSLYGMDKPVCEVEAVYADGSSHSIHMGGRSPLEDGYYGMVDNNPEVELLLSYDADLFMRKLFDYRTFALFHDMGDEAEAYAELVKEIIINRADGSTLSVKREASADELVSTVTILEPVLVAGDEYAFYQKLITPLFSFKNAKLQLVEDLPADLARYGLNAPATLWVKDEMGATRVLIGTEENGRTYLMTEGIPAVYSVKSSALNFLSLDYSVIMDRLVWLHDVDKVTKLHVELNGSQHALEVLEMGASFRFDGKDVSADLARALYRSSISLQYDGRAEGTAAADAPVCVLTFDENDGQSYTLSLHALNERHLEVVLDGETTGFYVNKSAMQQLTDALAALAN